ncbi:MAG: DUF4105 domain-containing protein [Gemmatimonadetes bacterium]|nr:DUF4105 domain-containing protein [Gemmatimonadota bacterium]MDA1102784.1 DUF4105 domain-containing protein [Gemmatimonadota bacterium]
MMLPVVMYTSVAGAALPCGAAGQQPPREALGEIVARSSPDPGSELRVWLVTAGPGDAVWERYGHNAIRILDTETGRDVAYNWGIFDFQQVDFIPRFLQGRMLYMMVPFQSLPMIDAYARANREITLQELDLTPTQKLALSTLADLNARPERREYFYQYFLDNCSTRVRDLLDQVLGGALNREFAAEPSGSTYRDQTRRLTQVDPLIYTGMDLLLGGPTDAPMSVWEEMFVPMTLRDAIRSVTVTRSDGSVHPLVLSEEIAVESTRAADPTEPPRWLGIYVFLGLLLAAAIASSTTTRVRSTPALRIGVLTLTVGWSALGGIAGTLLVLLLLTDHTFAYWNENLFLFNPLMLASAVLLPMARLGARWRQLAWRTAAAIAIVASLGVLWQLSPASRHQNAMFFALALPAHLALAFAISRRGFESSVMIDAANGLKAD